METDVGTVTGERPGQKSMDMEQCIINCSECARVCIETIPSCLKSGGRHADPDHIMMLMNCAQICRTSANFMISGSPLHMKTCDVCAETCDACADSCATAGDEDFMQRCVDFCRRCADSCRKMAAH